MLLLIMTQQLKKYGISVREKSTLLLLEQELPEQFQESEEK